MKHLTPILLLLTLIVGFVTRGYLLGEAPHGLYLDEAGQGYSAYSIYLTGKDEFGMPFPVVFRSFTDFKTPVYIYLVAPLIPYLGLTKLAVRFPSFFFSILTFPLLYYLIKKLLPKVIPHSSFLAALCVFMLSLSPWHILFGRTNFECNVALFFFLTGVYFFYKALKKPWYFVLAGVLFAIAIPSYHSQRLVTPFMVLALSIRHLHTIRQRAFRAPIIVGVLFGVIILLPTLSVATTPGFLARATGLNIFSHHRQAPAGYLSDYNGPVSSLVNSSLYLSTKEFAALYTSYFSPRQMFHLGDYGPRSSFPYIGTFFLWQLPFYIHGLYLIAKKKELKEYRFFTITLMLIAPIPAAITRDPYATIRALPLVVPQTMVISLSLYTLFLYVTKNKRGLLPLFVALSLGVVCYSMMKLYSSVIILNEYYRGSEWNYGWEEVAQEIKRMDPSLPVVVDNSRSEPYSQLLFFLSYDPQRFQNENFEVSNEEYYTNMERNLTKYIGNIVTRPIHWDTDVWQVQYLIGDALAISDQQIAIHELELIRDIRYPDGTITFRIVKTNGSGR